MTPETDDACYHALKGRDARFDGHFFIAVTSTGIYCRPICRVRLPKRENCRFFSLAAQAEAAGFRPCLRCRPELAPGLGQRVWSHEDATQVLAQAAAALLDQPEAIQAQAPDTTPDDNRHSPLARVAARLGVSERHLRRLFQAHWGVSPLQYLQTRRLLLAKQLLVDSRLPMAAVAEAAGFGSVRRFNASFATHYRMPPSALRRHSPGPTTPTTAPTTAHDAVLRLAYRPPYAVDALLQFLAARAITGVEAVDVAQRRITRTLRLHHGGREHVGRIVVRFAAPTQDPPSVVELWPDAALWACATALIPLVRRWLDLDAHPAAIAGAFNAPDASYPLNLEPGLRLPGCTDRFELAVRAVLDQQITVAAARTLGTRLVARWGTALPSDANARQAASPVTHLFPTPHGMAALPLDALTDLGITQRRAETLIALARAWPHLRYAQAQANAHAGTEGSVTEALAELQTLPGIGPWTAHYMLMRGWSWPDAFPPGDVVLKKQRAALGQPDPAQWQPYRSYATLHLWRQASLS